jgi:hypothetical protein
MWVSERACTERSKVERRECENLWHKRVIQKKRLSQPVSCCFYLVFWMSGESSTVNELLRCCQQFGVQWMRLTLLNMRYLPNFDCTISSF